MYTLKVNEYSIQEKNLSTSNWTGVTVASYADRLRNECEVSRWPNVCGTELWQL